MIKFFGLLSKKKKINSLKTTKLLVTTLDEVVVNGAELKDGMLIVDLEKIVPEEKQPRSIKIS